MCNILKTVDFNKVVSFFFFLQHNTRRRSRRRRTNGDNKIQAARGESPAPFSTQHGQAPHESVVVSQLRTSINRINIYATQV